MRMVDILFSPLTYMSVHTKERETARQDENIRALNRLYDARDPVHRGALVRRMIDGAVDRDDSLASLLDVIVDVSEQNPMRSVARAEARESVRKHPGSVSDTQLDALRKALEAERPALLRMLST